MWIRLERVEKLFHSLISKHWRKILLPLIAVSALLALLFIPRGRAEHPPILLSEQNSFLNNFSEEETENELNIEEEEKEASIIIVDVQGAVRFPGVYSLSENDRLIDAIQAAGGYVEGADTRFINHALKLEDEMLIYIPVEGEAIDENDNRHSIIGRNQSSSNSSTNDGSTVNINTAPLEQLMTLPGIGPKKAESIINYREEEGPFQTIEEIMNISGIGQKTFEKLQQYLTVK